MNDINAGTRRIYVPIIKEILAHRLEFEKITFVLEGRKSNSEAHSLAHHVFL
jgi:hypothetical protein